MDVYNFQFIVFISATTDLPEADTLKKNIQKGLGKIRILF